MAKLPFHKMAFPNWIHFLKGPICSTLIKLIDYFDKIIKTFYSKIFQQSTKNSAPPYIHAKPLGILLKEIAENERRKNVKIKWKNIKM
jgi:hypothetical protein